LLILEYILESINNELRKNNVSPTRNQSLEIKATAVASFVATPRKLKPKIRNPSLTAKPPGAISTIIPTIEDIGNRIPIFNETSSAGKIDIRNTKNAADKKAQFINENKKTFKLSLRGNAGRLIDFLNKKLKPFERKFKLGLCKKVKKTMQIAIKEATPQNTGIFIKYSK